MPHRAFLKRRANTGHTAIGKRKSVWKKTSSHFRRPRPRMPSRKSRLWLPNTPIAPPGSGQTLGNLRWRMAIGHLRDLAEVVQSSGNPSTWEALADYYSTIGWKADRSVLQALDAATVHCRHQSGDRRDPGGLISRGSKNFPHLPSRWRVHIPPLGRRPVALCRSRRARFISLPTACAWISPEVWKRDS